MGDDNADACVGVSFDVQRRETQQTVGAGLIGNVWGQTLLDVLILN